ncbi:MAG TPA: hypothetical protein VM261_17195 [Kofleriaceae bacterium]|nr:hypothetical protein [Kofleriaceae bacterium]
MSSIRWFLFAGLFVVPAALAACNVNRVNRAALVPHMTPTLRSGAPMETPGEIAIGASSLAHSTLGSTDDSAAVEVPGTQAEGNMRLRVGPHVALGLLYAEGFDAGAKKIKDTQPDVEGGNVRGWGFTLSSSIPTGSPQWTVGLNSELLFWSVPWIEYSTCVMNCGGFQWTVMTEDRATISQLAVGVVPTYRAGKMNLWGGLTFRNHPTIEQKGTEVGVDISDEVEEGSFNTVLSAGADLELGGGFRAGATLYQVVQGEPAKYGPSLAVMITIPLGRHDTPAPPAAPTAPTAPVYPGYPPPPPPPPPGY